MRGFSLPRLLHNSPLATPVALRVVFFAAIIAGIDRPFSRLTILTTPVVFRVVLSTANLHTFRQTFPLLYH